jgi:septal ring factor EnvC (AmiA/AmiB activator)
MIAVWPALAILLAGVLAGLVFALLRGLRMWRAFKATGGRIGDRVGEVSRGAAEIETHLERAADSSERLAAALERLHRSRARLEVQLAAVREARDVIERAVPFLAGR